MDFHKLARAISNFYLTHCPTEAITVKIASVYWDNSCRDHKRDFCDLVLERFCAFSRGFLQACESKQQIWLCTMYN